MSELDLLIPPAAVQVRPRLGFLGVGWIGRSRMQAIAGSDLASVAAIADPSAECRNAAAETVGGAGLAGSLEELLEMDLDGIVIATPSALHADQAVAALEHGLAVFCQKPLGRNAAETARVVDAARAADRLLGVDLSYRFVAGAEAMRRTIMQGELGHIHAVDLTFHNAYGPDKSWFYDPELSGGGCVIDLGIHLVDLALWTLGFPEVLDVQSHLFAKGRRLGRGEKREIEDYAVAQIELAGGTVARVACSWNLPAGRDAIIEASFYGASGGAALRNVNGSFYDFTVERYQGTSRRLIASPPDAWGGRAAVQWAGRLAAGERFDPAAGELVRVAEALDAIYRE